MQDGRPSQTAFMVAVLRAHHYLSTQEPRVVSDNLAMQFVGLNSQSEISDQVDRLINRFATDNERNEAEQYVYDLMLRVCARSCFVEDQLTASLARRMKQLVILGAGLDSTAYRRQDITADLQIFEVDYPATQNWKREQLAAIGVPIPKNLTFVPIDFEHQTLAEGLIAGGVQMNAMTFFSWLGVQPYLTDEAVMSTLDVITTFPSGSELVLDLVTPSHRSKNIRERLQQLVGAVGEPFKSAYEPEEFNTRLQQRGFSQIDIVNVSDWFLRHSARFQGRFSQKLGPSVLASAQVI